MELLWNQLNVCPKILSIIDTKFGFNRMTPVQSATIPLFLSNKDVAVEAVTGSGKTLAFVIPIVEILLRKSRDEPIDKCDIGAVILSPTRELATQIYDVLNMFCSDETLGLRCLLFIGGTNPVEDIEKYTNNGANVIVSTPGRINDLFERSSLMRAKVKKCLEVFVLDEADQLLNMGFEKCINTILSYLPKQRRTGLFSATQTKKLEHLIRAGLRNPVKVEIKEKVMNSIEESIQMPLGIANNFITLESYCDKLPFILQFIKSNVNAKYLLFMSTCVEVNYFEEPITKFIGNLIPVFKIHRKLRKKRQKIFNNFRKCQNGVMICTDVMSRGVDIPQVDWVLHFDLPNTVESYVHRCGRSGHQIGTFGNTLLLTLKSETEFIELCQNKGIELKELITNIKIDNSLKTKIISHMKRLSRKNSNYYELGMQSFTSFIRTYSSKQCMSSILFKILDLIDVANGYALLKLPAMPELRSKLKENNKFITTPQDKDIANKHKKHMQSERSKKKPIVEESDVIPDHEIQRLNRKNMIKNTKLKGKRKRELIDDIEIDELMDDSRMVKKLKKGKITSKEFDDYFGI